MMNQAHLHLIVNHLPIVFPIVGIIVLLDGLIIKSEIVKRTSFYIFIIGALCTIAAGATGEGAEEVVENIAGITHSLIHRHEESAEKFAFASYALGLLSLIAFVVNYKRLSFSSIMSWLVVIVAAITIVLGSWTGTTGGEIRHTEIRKGQNSIIHNNNTIESNESASETDEEH